VKKRPFKAIKPLIIPFSAGMCDESELTFTMIFTLVLI